MSGVNKVILIGNLGADPELKYTPSGVPVINVNMATSESWTKDGEKKSKTEWHKLVFWRKVAEIVGQYAKKGSTLYIEGKLQTRSWEKEGEKRYTTEVVVDRMEMIGGRGEKKEESQQNYESEDEGDDLPF